MQVTSDNQSCVALVISGDSDDVTYLGAPFFKNVTVVFEDNYMFTMYEKLSDNVEPSSKNETFYINLAQGEFGLNYGMISAGTP